MRTIVAVVLALAASGAGATPQVLLEDGFGAPRLDQGFWDTAPDPADRLPAESAEVVGSRLVRTTLRQGPRVGARPAEPPQRGHLARPERVGRQQVCAGLGPACRGAGLWGDGGEGGAGGKAWLRLAEPGRYRVVAEVAGGHYAADVAPAVPGEWCQVKLPLMATGRGQPARAGAATPLRERAGKVDPPDAPTDARGAAGPIRPGTGLTPV